MNKKLSFYESLIIALGTGALFACFLHSFYQSIQLFVFLILALVFFFLIDYLSKQEKKIGMLCFFIGLCVFGLLFHSQFLTGLQALYNGMVEAYAAHDNYVFEMYSFLNIEEGQLQLYATMVLLFVYCLYVLVLSITIRARGLYFLDFLLSAAIFVTTVIYQMPQNYLINLFVFSFWILLFLLMGLKRLSFQEHQLPRIIKNIMLCSICVAFLFLLVFPSFLYQPNARIELLRAKIESLYKETPALAEEKLGEIDLRNAGDRFSFGTIEMKVHVEKKQQLYLKNYSASVYEDKKWKMLSDDDYKSFNFDWPSLYLWITNFHKLSDPLGKQKVEIEMRVENDNYAPTPYYLMWPLENSNTMYDAYLQGGATNYTYHIWHGEEELEPVTNRMAVNYTNFVKRSYLQIPSEVSTLFDQLGIEDLMRDGKENPAKAYELIRSYLEKTATYNLRPGKTPEETEFIRYFLTQNKQGYCVHFATSATMLFRYLGIPARYVEGFRVDESLFDSNLDAYVSDKYAHAWVEVFDEKLGWTPLEVTPGTPNSENTANTLANTTTPKPTQTPETPKEEPQTTTPNEPNTQVPTQDVDLHLDILLPITVSCFILVGLIKVRQLRYRKWEKKMKQANLSKSAAACYAYLKKWESYGKVSLQPMQPLFDKAAYSKKGINEQEYQQLYRFTQKEAARIYQSCSRIKKLHAFWIAAI